MQTRPNIVLITSHDLGRHLGCYGISTVTTPHIDRLAGQGVLFRNSFCVAPQCSPSRAAIATGRYPHSNGVMGLSHSSFGWTLHPDEVHIARRLNDIGYDTILGSYHHEAIASHDKLGFTEWGKAAGLAPDLARSMVQYMRQRPATGRPFYLQLAFTEPHRGNPATDFMHPPDASRGVAVPPYLVDEPSAREEIASFQGAIRGLDAGIGILLDWLDVTDQARNTLVLFCADHGIPFPRAKCTLYDPGLETALLLRCPDQLRLRAGSEINHLVSNVDYLPTILELLQQPVPPGVQGRSFAPLLLGDASTYRPHDEIFGEMTYHEYYDPMRCIRTDRHKLIVNFTTAPSFMDSSQCWRPMTITRHPPEPALAYHPAIELYDLHADPLETHNNADDPALRPLRLALLDKLRRWMESTHDPLLAGPPTPPAHRHAMAALFGARDDRPGEQSS